MPAPLITVVGPVTRDVTMVLDELPGEGGSATARELVVAAGGKGANPAVAAARLGARVRLIGAVGDDEAGEQALRELSGLGVNVAGVARRAGVPTGQIVHLVQPGGRRRYVEVAGANDDPGVSGDAIVSACDAGTTLLVSTALPRADVVTAVAAGRHAGARIALDVAGDPETARAVLGDAHVVRGDGDEIAALLDCEVRDFETAAAAARHLLDESATAELAVVQAGGDGDVVVTREQEIRLPHLDVEVVDPTGGGDALIATLLVLLACGRPLEPAARLASAASAHVVARLGGRPQFGDEAELAELLGTA